MAPEPLISVVMGVFNEATTLPRALDSLRGQDYPHWQAIVVEDGSEDATAAILHHYHTLDPRIRPVFLPRNQGLTQALNLALSQANSPYIARLDGDDLCLPQRLSRQVAILEAQPRTLLVAGSWQVAEEQGRRTVHPPQPEGVLRWFSLFANPFCHGSVLFRRLWQGRPLFYNAAYPLAQDYELWSRLLTMGRAVVLEDPPLICRFPRPQGLSMTQREKQYQAALTIAQGQLQPWLPGQTLSLPQTARLRTAATGPPALDAPLARDFLLLLDLFANYARSLDHEEQLLVGHHLVKSMLDTVSRASLSLAWQSGLLQRMAFVLPRPLLAYGLRRLSRRLTSNLAWKRG